MMSSETPMRDIASVADDCRNMSCAVPTQAQASENNDGMTSADVLQEAAASTLLQLHGREPSDTEQRGEHSLTEQPTYQSRYLDGDRQFHSRSLVNIPSALNRDNAISENYTSIPQNQIMYSEANLRNSILGLSHTVGGIQKQQVNMHMKQTNITDTLERVLSTLQDLKDGHHSSSQNLGRGYGVEQMPYRSQAGSDPNYQQYEDHPYVNNERVTEHSGTELRSRDIRERPSFSSSNSREMYNSQGHTVSDHTSNRYANETLSHTHVNPTEVYSVQDQAYSGQSISRNAVARPNYTQVIPSKEYSVQDQSIINTNSLDQTGSHTRNRMSFENDQMRGISSDGRQSRQLNNWYNAPYEIRQRQFQRQDSQRRQQSSNCHDLKLPPFNGKEDWKVWINRFEAIAERRNWSEETRLDNLLPKLQGRAGDFVFTQLPRSTLLCYADLIKELNSRFRVVETQKTFAAKFSQRAQRPDETVEEFAADLKRLYA